MYKEWHPEAYALNDLRKRAHRRKIPFGIGLGEFMEFCRCTGYLQKKGQTPNSATIDRINHDEGYYIWNIHVLDHAENSKNGHLVPGRETAQNAQQPEYPEREPDYIPPQESDVPF
jgi:hypothetical protein